MSRVDETRPLVSVVLPACNAEAVVGDAVASVLAQTYDRLELVVVDDGSNDRTAEVAGSLGDARVRVLREAHRGVVRSRNAGLRAARGELVAFIDADDVWSSDKLDVQLTFLAEHPEVVAVGCFLRYESLDGRALGVAGRPVGAAEQEAIAVGALMPFPCSALVFRRETLEELGGFDEELGEAAVSAEDLDLLARAARLGPIGSVPRVLGAYRVHGASASARGHASQKAAARFVRARLRARDAGGDLSWEDFAATYRATLRQRHGDRVQRWYRSAGVSLAERRWGAAAAYGVLALLAGPRYSLRRLARQRPSRGGVAA